MYCDDTQKKPFYNYWLKRLDTQPIKIYQNVPIIVKPTNKESFYTTIVKQRNAQSLPVEKYCRLEAWLLYKVPFFPLIPFFITLVYPRNKKDKKKHNKQSTNSFLNR